MNKTIDKYWLPTGCVLIALAALAGIVASTRAQGVPAPAIAIAMTNASQLSISVTNGVTNGSYSLYTQPVLGGSSWMCVTNAKPGVTKFLVAADASTEGYFYVTGSNTLPPVASFTMSTNIGVAPFTVAFTDTSSHSPGSWSWSFGDGGASTLQNPSHAFTNMWRQTVTLTVSNAHGKSASSQAVFQCFPCDAVYDWANGVPGQIASVAALSNSLVPGGNKIGNFTVTNHDLPSISLQGLIFTNLPGMTNGCPVVFSNGIIYSNFNTTNALAYNYTNDHEWFDFNFNVSCVITDVVWIFYESMPFSSNTWCACIDEACINTAYVGGFCLNRNLGYNGPLLPGYQNDYHTSETLAPGSKNTYGSFNGITNIYQLPNKIYRILMEENTNGICVLAIADPVTSTLTGFTTNLDQYEIAGGHPFTQLMDGHVSGEIFITNDMSILAYHDVISLNRPLTWSQVSNVVMFGP